MEKTPLIFHSPFSVLGQHAIAELQHLTIRSCIATVTRWVRLPAKDQAGTFVEQKHSVLLCVRAPAKKLGFCMPLTQQHLPVNFQTHSSPPCKEVTNCLGLLSNAEMTDDLDPTLLDKVSLNMELSKKVPASSQPIPSFHSHPGTITCGPG